MDARLAAEFPLRRARLDDVLERAGIDVLFVPPSADLEYLTGIERDLPTFGRIAYAHGWVTGAFIARGRPPLYVLPRMFVVFHLGGRPPGESVVVGETDDGRARFHEAARRFPGVTRIGLGSRTWARTTLELQDAFPGAELVDSDPPLEGLRRVKSAVELELMATACRIATGVLDEVRPLVVPGATVGELAAAVEHALRAGGSRCPSFPTHVFTWSGHDSGDQTSRNPVADRDCILFDFGAVHEGYCSDFGRTVVCGTAPPGFDEAHAVLLAAQEAGRTALVPGARACDVNAACRAPLEEAGLGDAFRHRMGHGIGLDVHERPFLSPEDETPLEEGMTFTDEPSLLLDGRFGVRVEDVVVCAPGGGRVLSPYTGGAREP